MWRWDSDAFGKAVPNGNPAGLGTFEYNLRFPGQQYDAIVGLHYNYFRDYDPATGRYAQSDPIGLEGGSLGTYSYVGGNPVSAIDPLGLWQTTVDAYCMRYPAACPEVLGGNGIKNGLKALGAAAATAAGITALTNPPCPDDCGPDTRIQAQLKALAWAGTDILMNGWSGTPWNQYGGRGGPNYTYVRQNGGNNYGYSDPKSRAGIFNHPDGHPHQVGDGFPEHHKCPHFHAISPTGAEQIFIYKRGT
jgi:RHS repeat-associated protein